MTSAGRKLITFVTLVALVVSVGIMARRARHKHFKDARARIDAQPNPVWPPPPDKPRVKWVKFIRDEYDVGAVKRSRFLDALAGKKKAIVALRRPMDVAVDANGTLFVLDLRLGVLKFDFAHKKIVNLSRVADYFPKNPVAVAVDSHFLYVSDSAGNRVIVYDKAGHLIKMFADKRFIDWPVGIAIDGKAGLLFIVNGHGNDVVVLNSASGKLVRRIGKRGSEPGQFNYPTYITLLSGRRFAVVDTGNFRVQLFNYKGKFLRTFGKLGDRPGEFSRPKGITVDSDGNLYVVDGAFGNIQVFNQKGRLLTFIGRNGHGKGQFTLPLGITCRNDMIYVADQLNRRIQVLRYLKPQGKEG